MVRARDNHTQQCYNFGGHVNTKPSNGGMHHQTGHHQETHHRPFPEIESSYAAEITEAIPNLHVGVNASNQGMPAGEAGSNKTKNPFTGPYYTYYRFYRHETKDCCDIQTLAKQRTQKKDRPLSGRNRGMNNSPYRSNELRRRRPQEARDNRQRRETGRESVARAMKGMTPKG
ncbi:hypothetical protein Fot_05466 [Forsythia ovata]|uniref:Uncharacterized protein n=1 Tax=Forsythia ovata TaxID=205694 RepID=A0ABD1WQ77_9LAMI